MTYYIHHLIIYKYGALWIVYINNKYIGTYGGGTGVYAPNMISI